MRKLKKIASIIIGISSAAFASGGLAAQHVAQGFIAAAYDYQVTGCAYDPAAPTADIQVHVIEETGSKGVIGIAGGRCPWSTDPRFAGHGFVIQYRHPLQTYANVRVGFTSADKSNTVWTNTNLAGQKTAQFDRAHRTFFYSTSSYKIGISRKYGAGISEYYNLRVDPTMNLVYTDPGSMIQTAYFGDSYQAANPAPFAADQAFTCTGAVSGSDRLFNPTQSGSGCPDKNGEAYGSGTDDNNEVTCTGVSGPHASELCGTTLAVHVAKPNDANPDVVRYFLRYRNYLYPANSSSVYPYQSYDSVYGYVTYSFYSNRVSVEYQSWVGGIPTVYSNLSPINVWNFPPQQMPVAFLVGFSKVTAGVVNPAATSVISRTADATIDYDSASTAIPGGKQQIYYQPGAEGGRWLMAEAYDNRPKVPLPSPNNHLTLGFYSTITGAPSAQHPDGVECPSRVMSATMGGLETPTTMANVAADTWTTVNNSLVLQSNSFAPILPAHFYRSSVVLSPYHATDKVPGASVNVATLIDTPVSRGGWMPAWECNQ